MTSESFVRYFAIFEILLIVSEFNIQYINKSVWEFDIFFLIFRMWIKNAHHQTNQENWFRISCFAKLIRIKFWRCSYPWKLTLSDMRQVPRCHSNDFIKISRFSHKMTSHSVKHCIWPVIWLRIKKVPRADMESATFEPLGITQFFYVTIF